MPWFRVDDTFHSHPKARTAGLNAIGLWTLAGSHAMAYKLEGRVPDYFIDGFKRDGARAADMLVRQGLWLPEGSDYRFHDWDDYQPSADEIERDRERARERQRKFRKKLRGIDPEEGDKP